MYTPTDRPMSVRNHFVIGLFGWVFVLSLCLLYISVGKKMYMGFCRGTESDLVLLLVIRNLCCSKESIFGIDQLKLHQNIKSTKKGILKIKKQQNREGSAAAEWLSSWLAEQEDRGSIPGLATWIFRDWLSPASKSRYG